MGWTDSRCEEADEAFEGVERRGRRGTHGRDVMNHLEIMANFQQRWSCPLSQEDETHADVEELLGAAITTRNDFRMHAFGMMTNNIPSNICISFNIASLTALIACARRLTRKKAVSDGRRRRRSMTAL